VRRHTAGNEANFIQVERLPDLQGRTQVSVMNGVEGAAEYANHAEWQLTGNRFMRVMPV